MRFESCEEISEYIAKRYKGKLKVLRTIQHPMNPDICMVQMITEYQAKHSTGVLEPTIKLYYYLPKDKAHIVAHKSLAVGNATFKYVVGDYCNEITEDGSKTICTIDLDLENSAADIKIADLDAKKYLDTAITEVLEE